MKTGILIVAHAPLASALREAVLHTFPEFAHQIAALNIDKNTAAEQSLVLAQSKLAQLATPQHVVLTDIFGATPCNVCQLLVEGTRIPLLSGASLPMLMRAVTYQDQALETVVQRALEGGTKGVMRVGSVLRTAA